MLYYPGDEYVQMENICLPYLYYDENEKIQIKGDAPEEAKKAYVFCKKFNRDSKGHWN